MLTPVDIQSKTFKSGMGYSKADVDAYMATVASDYESLYRENLELKDKLGNMNETINHYRNIEKSLQKALVLAEQTSEETIASAKKNATVIEQEAVLKADSIVADAKIELDHVRTETVKLLQQYESYRSQFKSLANAQVELLESKAYDIEIASLDAFSTLEKETSENAGTVNAKAQYQDASKKVTVENKEQESAADVDETIGDDIKINDLASLFESENQATDADSANSSEQKKE